MKRGRGLQNNCLNTSTSTRAWSVSRIHSKDLQIHFVGPCYVCFSCFQPHLDTFQGVEKRSRQVLINRYRRSKHANIHMTLAKILSLSHTAFFLSFSQIDRFRNGFSSAQWEILLKFLEKRNEPEKKK